MLKVELHSHTSADPHDYIPHSTTELIDRAGALGYGALAITLHAVAWMFVAFANTPGTGGLP